MTEHTVEHGDEVLLIATDGLWEFVTSQEACDIVATCKDPYQAAQKLIEAAWRAWFTEDVRSDDITVVVVYLDAKQIKKEFPTPPGASLQRRRHRSLDGGRPKQHAGPNSG